MSQLTANAATRGQIVQRVLVDGWSAAEAAAAFGLAERQVARWVAAYRRHGMASLRDGGEAAVQRWLWRPRRDRSDRDAASSRPGSGGGASGPPASPQRRHPALTSPVSA